MIFKNMSSLLKIDRTHHQKKILWTVILLMGRNFICIKRMLLEELKLAQLQETKTWTVIQMIRLSNIEPIKLIMTLVKIKGAKI